jgi:glycosyltransferase involved in cell wall biosynthesis
LDCDLGSAWQAECYVRGTLAEETGAAVERRKPRIKVWDRFRRRIPRIIASARHQRRAPTIGLVGCGSASGLGYLDWDLAQQGLIDTWLLVEDPRRPPVEMTAVHERIVRVRADPDERVVRRWLRDLDWVAWGESSRLRCLPRLARAMGIRVACIPMWEWTSPIDEQLRDVDLLICPTLHAFRVFTDWKKRFGFRWQIAHFPWPVSADRFQFRLRQRCQRFVFVNGHGGVWASDIENHRRLCPRKGLDIVLGAAALAPEIPWTVYTQDDLGATPPPNVEVRMDIADHAELYREGDVCVQPSRWEGIGLPLLECQMAGMPLITVDAPPMNEYHALHCLSPAPWTWGYLTAGQPMRIPIMSSEALADIVRKLYGCDLRAASAAAHKWVRDERSWDQAAPRWREIFEEYVPQSADDE